MALAKAFGLLSSKGRPLQPNARSLLRVMTPVRPTAASERNKETMVESFRESAHAADARAAEAASRADRLQASFNSAQRELTESQTTAVRLEAEVREIRGQAERTAATLAEKEASLAAACAGRDEAVASVHRLEGELRSLKESADRASAEAASRTADLEERLEEAQAQAAKAEETVATQEAELATVKEAHGKLSEDHEAAMATGREMASRVGSLEGQIAALKDSMGQSREQQATALVEVTADRDTLRSRLMTMEQLQQRLAEREEEVAALQDDVYDLQMKRRGLHNKIQDMRGSIRVYVRVRPVLKGDLEEEAAAAMPAGVGTGLTTEEAMAEVPTVVACGVDGETLALSANTSRLTKAAASQTADEPSKRSFKFDVVFGPDSTQQDVFDDVSAFVQSALDGFQVCLFSYGQTGSGKTHTMQGGSGDARGLIPRSVEQILATTRQMRRQGWQYTLEATFLEIYNEKVCDLLTSLAKPATASSSSSSATSAVTAADTGKGLPIHFDAKTGDAEVPGLVRKQVDTTAAIEEVLVAAASSRSVASTSMNAVSSRSHSVFTLHIRGENKHKGVVVRGKLNLCDLAGSERLARSKAEGSRLKETQAINKSLSNLADVFSSLSKKSAHVSAPRPRPLPQRFIRP